MSSISYVAGWADAPLLIADELKQLEEEGRDPKWVKALVDRNKPNADLWDELQQAPARQDFSFREPSDLKGIHAARPPGASRRWKVDYSDDVLMDRMHGAWLGRCCGCALGKPVEGFMEPTEFLTSQNRIKTYLQGIGANEYPLNNYFPLHSPAEGQTGKVGTPASCRENISFMESDDDIRYTVIGQRVLLEKGASFTTFDVMRTWMRWLPYGHMCTAETQAYRNYILRYYVRLGVEEEIDWNWVATFQNPYREWIGAQIRADSWGYAAPGNPELAADFAWRDARMSHVKNGIYGEMFVAAMIAAAYVLDDPPAVVEAGLAEIPEGSRLYRDMRDVVDVCRKFDFKAEAFEEVFEGLQTLLGHYHPVHTNNNAALVVAALLLGGHDFEKAITISVMGGWDTDCNGATVGSIFGAMHGTKKIPAKWSAPLHDTLMADVPDYHPIAISECARKSFEIAKKILAG